MEDKQNLRPDIYKSLVADLGYAVKSESNNLVYETYGKALMAEKLGAITFDQFWKINTVAVHCWMNGGAGRKKKSLEQFEKTEW